ncbi:MAG: SulP family inorganic anion transporter, partial [Gammaproteobacteria bacterium]|nr:SulP family inorganic anion transporter [Gammaproteobacteria bacterium]
MQEANSIWSRFKKEDLTAGLSVGFVRSLGIGISLFGVTSIVFSGGLEPYIRSGTEIWFFGTALLCVILAFFSKFESPLATTPLPVVVVLVAIAQSLDLTGYELFITFAFVIFLCAALSGILFFLIGSLRLANVFRFVPFSVSAGALTGAGLLIALFALKLVGFSWTHEFWASLQDPVSLSQVLSSLFLFVILVIANKYWGAYWTMPLLFLLFCAVFHVCLYLLGVSMEDATTAGFFVATDWSSRGWPFYELTHLQAVNWMSVVSQIPNALTLFFVLLVLTAVGYAQLEIATRREFDWNSEFRLHGMANVASGLGGGIPGGMVATLSIPNIALKANTPINSLVIAAVMVLFLIFGIDLLRFVPLPAPSGYLLFVAYLLVSEWLFRSRQRLQFPDYCMLLLIATTIVLVGFLEGIVLGIVLSLVFFAYRLSQVPLVESNFSIREQHSPQARSIPDRSILRVYGLRAQVYQLRGYAFFGSAFALATELNKGLRSDPHPVCVILDFSKVTGFDLSALDSLRGYIRNALAENVTIILCMTSDDIRRELERDLGATVLEQLVWVDNKDGAQ